MVGNGEATAGYVGAVELSFAGATGELVELLGRLLERQLSGILHDWDDEALLTERGADADVDRRRR